MYSQFYGFRDKPFSLLPDPDFLFLSEKHEKALNLLELGILNQSGFCVISGEIGAGKTTLVRELLNRLDETVRVGLISNTHSGFSDLLGWVLAAYELKSDSNDAAVQHRRFTDFIIEQYAAGKHTLLIIDEAQNLSLSALEQLRMLSNINSEKDLVLQIILVGQSELRAKLQQPELEQFAQRIAIDYHLAALNQQETAAYIRHRVTRSGGSKQLFDNDACRLVYQFSEGIPRLINRICDLGLVYGYSRNKKTIDADLIKAVTVDQEIGQLIKTPTESPIDERQHAKRTKSRTIAGPGTTRQKIAPVPVKKSDSQRRPAIKKTNGEHAGANHTRNSSEQRLPGADIGAKSARPPAKKTETHSTETGSAIHTAAEKASIEKARAESAAADKNGISRTIADKSKADAALAAQAETEKLVAEKLAAEKVAAQKAAAEQAEASIAAAKRAESEKLAAARNALKTTSAVERATELAIRKKQTAEALIVEKTRIEKEALENAAALKNAAESALAERIAAEKAAAEKVAAAVESVRKATANRVAAEKVAASMVSDSEAAAQNAISRQTDAARDIDEKTANSKTAVERARADSDHANNAAAESVAAEVVAREKNVAAKQAVQTASASGVKAEMALAEKMAANTLAKEKASLETIALAKVAVSAAAAAQKEAARAAAARTAAEKEASEKEAAAVEAARRAVKANALAEKAKAAAENRTLVNSSERPSDRESDSPSHSVNQDSPAATQPQVLAIQANQNRAAPRRIRTILALSVVTGIMAASLWLITKPGGTATSTHPSVVAGKSYTTPGPMTEAAALETEKPTSATR